MIKALNASKLVVCIGPGGVGKTSVSAGLGLAAAQSGRKTLVLTVDPAKRLADALGITIALNQPTKVGKSGNLFAMMFDVEKGWQELLCRELGRSHFSSRLRHNRFFEHLAQQLPGSHEFVACDEVFEYVKRAEFDLIILDTPPSAQGLQFLDAPQNMVHFFENELFLSFLRSRGLVGKATFGLFDRGATLIKKSLSYFADKSFIHEMFDFIYLLRDLYPVLTRRARQFQDILASKMTQFLVVTRPETSSLLVAAALGHGLTTRNYNCAGAILNQVSPLFSGHLGDKIPDIFSSEYQRAAIEREIWKQAGLDKNLFPRWTIIPRLLSHNLPLERIAKIAQALQNDLHENTGIGH